MEQKSAEPSACFCGIHDLLVEVKADNNQGNRAMIRATKEINGI